MQKISLKNIIYFILIYLSLLFLSCSFSKNIKALFPPFYFILSLSLGGMLLNLLLSGLMALSKDSLGAFFKHLLLFVFCLLQGLMVCALSAWVFRLPASYCIVFSLVSFVSFMAVLLLPRLPQVLCFILASILGALLLTVSLRIGGVFLSLASSFLFLNLLPLSLKLVSDDHRKAWMNILSFWGLLFLARAVIQYYLIHSGYESLGVVISQPYTFAALFAGVAVAYFFDAFREVENFPRLALAVFLALVFPSVIGFVFHARPLAGYLMGLSISAYFMGLFKKENEDLILLTLLSFLFLSFGVDLFKSSLTQTRTVSLIILSGGVLVSLVYFSILFFVTQRKKA